MKKTKLLWLAPIATALAASPVLAAASCGTMEVTYQKDYMVKYINTPNSYTAYHADYSASYGGLQSRFTDSTMGMLIRQESFGRPVVENDPLAGKFIVKKPTFWKYTFELGSKVVFVDNSGQEIVFDSDDADPELVKKDAEGNYPSALEQAKSNNDKSINSKKFDETRRRRDIKSMKIVVRKGVKWVNSKGEETKYEIKAQDFYYSWMRTWGLTTSARASLVGDPTLAAKLDEYASEVISPKQYFIPQRNYPNEYLYGLYGVDSAQFRDPDKLITKTSANEEAVTINKKADEDQPDFYNLFINLTTSYDFVAAPSDYINEHKDGKLLIPFESKQDSGSFRTMLIDELAKLKDDSIAKKAGLYWYGLNDENVLYAGRYYYAGYNKETREESLALNKHYFVKPDPKAVKKYVIKYAAQDGGDSTTFRNKEFDEFRKGNISSLPWGELTVKSQNKVLREQEKHGFVYAESTNIYESPYWLLWNILPQKIGPKTTVDSLKQSMNDVFSKLVYGVTLNDLVENNNALRGKEVLEHNIVGSALTFRSLISCSINWSYLVSELTNGNGKAWVNPLTPDSTIGGKEAGKNPDGSEYKPTTLRQDYENANTLHAYDKDGNLVKFTYNGQERTEITPELNTDYYAKGAQSNDDKLKSVAYEAIKAKMKEFLDDFYNKNPNLKGQKIQWNCAHRWLNWTPAKYDVYFPLLEKLIKGLDDRLAPKFVRWSEGEKDKWNEDLVNGYSGISAFGWGYDINQSGSGFDGASGNGLSSALLAIGGPDANSKAIRDKLAKNFPMLAKIAEELYAFISQPKYQSVLSVPADKWALLSITDLHDLRFNLESYKWDDIAKKLIPAADTDNFIDLGSLTSKFFVSWVNNHTNAESTQLSKEFSNYMLPVWDERKSILAAGFGNAIISTNFDAPVVGTNNVWVSDIKFSDVQGETFKK